ncbi:hypothetical protein PF005_g13288 [Phytophthora fragariae]|uniref:Uncharacterized protein n=2 Tax=Phytophthora TaxID=4783 RepID=A0A6A3U4R2_9STRA|nr:hypothetical protein PF003_g7825 [Phytophthora fragariae]KAE9032183.1 hypothetical protein PR002_g9306 [Phytophthora rubi]KAE8934741.1 hypothetical protein PF009_g15278 [Phytophthora fragariae]KAE9004252.1 hypothetical protein PF011_g12528 [Phytophthora fragariae]KAE9035271.1 hypothetical protein PR001_g9376 [Phytophthora rubi]
MCTPKIVPVTLCTCTCRAVWLEPDSWRKTAAKLAIIGKIHCTAAKCPIRALVGVLRKS